jgi:predicted RNase H-like nuclease (RuvC/YqgF family)
MKSEQKIEELEKQIEELKQELKKDSKHEEMEQWFKSLLNGLEIEINDKYTNEVFYKKMAISFLNYINVQKKHIFCVIFI